MKAFGFSFLKSLVKKASGEFEEVILWALLMIKPEIIEGDSLLVKRSRTSYL